MRGIAYEMNGLAARASVTADTSQSKVTFLKWIKGDLSLLGHSSWLYRVFGNLTLRTRNLKGYKT